jgi:putative nucleotidyltransferase with HDIG domain
MLSSGRSVSIPLSIFGFAVVIWLALLPVVPSSLPLSDGDISTRTIRAPHDISFTSEALTKKRQAEASDAINDSFVYDPSVASTQQAKLTTLLGRIRFILSDSATAPAARDAGLVNVENLSLSPATRAFLARMQPNDFTRIETEARRALASIYDQSVSAEFVQEVRERANTYVSASMDRDEANLVTEIIRPFIVTTLVIDKDRSQASREAARASVAPEQVTYAKGQVIVEKDSPITPQAVEALTEAGLIGNELRPELVGASAIMALVVGAAVTAGLRAFRPLSGFRQGLLIALAVALPVFIVKVLAPLVLPDDSRHFLAYVIPVSAAPMVLAGLVGAEMALLAGALVALLAAFAAVLVLDVTVVGLAGTLDIARIVLVFGIASAAGVFSVRNAERLGQFLIGGFYVGVTCAAVLLSLWLIDPERAVSDLPWIFMAGALNGVLCAFLSAGIFVTLGSMFGVTTRLQLLEMSQLSSPLLLRLQDEAPSTFQHSVIVANLAEKGAYVIGADALLARVGAYYHDIGKLVHPGFFIENQLGGPNPHDALAPADSARIIADHVTAGVQLAQQYKLPARVASFVPEHHGTRMVSFFYRRAAEQDPSIDPDAFRYPGPKPQSRETAIAMLADSTEAAVRSSPDHSAERIDAIVEEIFAERLTEGQLDESDITLKNLRALAQSFKDTLRAVYHPRVEYPAPTEAELLLRGVSRA